MGMGLEICGGQNRQLSALVEPTFYWQEQGDRQIHTTILGSDKYNEENQSRGRR